MNFIGLIREKENKLIKYLKGQKNIPLFLYGAGYYCTHYIKMLRLHGIKPTGVIIDKDYNSYSSDENIAYFEGGGYLTKVSY